MKRWSHWLVENLGISRMEANGILVLIPLLFIAIFLPAIYKSSITSKEFKELNFERMDKLSEGFTEKKESVEEDQTSYPREFNNSKDWKAKRKEWNQVKKETKRYPKYVYKYEVEPFDLNIADTTTLKQVRGIGSVLSSRIIKYRDLLGGYASLSQLSEVYGLSDSVIMGLDTLAVIEMNYLPSMIEINRLNEKELSRHPYLNYREAKAIVSYRYQHGDYESVSSLKKVILLDSIKIQKLEPYLKF